MARKRKRGHTIGKKVKAPMMGVTHRPVGLSLGTMYGKLRRK